MQVPFQLFSSTSSLGSSSSSLEHISLVPSRKLNAANTQVEVNAASGNICVRDTEFEIADVGSIFKIGMVWNSIDKQWRFAAAPKIKQTTSFIDRARSFVRATLSSQDPATLIEPDGRELQYTDDGAGHLVCNTANSEGLSFLVRNTVNNTIERTTPGSGIKEIFSADGTLLQRILPGNIIYSFQYDANRNVKSIQLPSGRQICLTPDNNNKNLLHLKLINDQKEISLADYSFDNKNLTTNVFNPDKSSYRTIYNLSNNKLKIESDDNTISTLSFDAAGKAASLEEGVSSEKSSYRNWTFSTSTKNSKNIFSIKDGDNNNYSMELDANNNPVNFTLPGDTSPTTYVCNRLGQPETITTPDKTHRSRNYSGKTGLLAKDSISKKYNQFVYNEADPKSSLFGAKLAEIKGEGSVKVGKFFIYNDQRQLIYEVSAEGRVTHYFYGPLDPNKPKSPSVLVAAKKVTSNIRYDLTTVNFDDIATYPTLEKLENYWNDNTKVQKSQLQVTNYSYDKSGRCNNETRYSTVNTDGNGIKNNTTAVTSRLLDEKGLTRELSIAVDDTKVISTAKVYDGLSRIKSITEGMQKNNPLQRNTTYTYSGNTTVINHDDILEETLIKDKGGLLESSMRSDKKNQLERQKEFKRNKNGSVSAVIREDGKTIQEIRDAQGRLQYRVLPGGNLEEQIYDLCGRLTCNKTYSILMPALVKPNDIPGIIAGDNNALTSYKLYDDNGQVTFEITVKRSREANEETPVLKAFVTQHFYQLGNKVHTTHYEKPLIHADLKNLSYQTFHPQVVGLDEDNNTSPPLLDDNDANNRSINYFYDKDDFLIGEQTCCGANMGFLKKLERDGAGNIYHEIVYQNKTAMSNDIAQATPADTSALETWKWYDNAGRLIAVLDPDKVLTYYDYYANGKIKSEITYKLPQNIDTTQRTIQRPESSVNDHTTSYEYDELGRKSFIRNSATGLEIHIEYDSQDNEIARTLTDTKAIPPTVRKACKEFNAFSEVIREGSERVIANKSPWVFHQYHQSNGLKLSTIDEKTSITLFYYDANRRPVLEISPLGTVKQYSYDNVCGKPTVVCCYANRIASEDLDQLKADNDRDGFYNPNIFNTILKPDINHDQINTLTYDVEGLIIKEVTATKAVRDLFYNAFNQISREVKDVDIDETNEEKIRLATDKNYDNRGNCTATIQDANGLNIKTAAEFDDPLNRPTAQINELEARVEITHKGLRRQELKDITDPSRQQTVIQDAFMRPDSTTDWNNQNPIKHEYNEQTREHTIISSENSSRNIVETSNAYGDVEKRTQGINTTQFSHGVDGQLEKTTFADGSSANKTFNVQSLLSSQTDRAGNTTNLHRNKDKQIDQQIEDPDGEQRVTNFTPDAFNNNTLITTPGGVIKSNIINQAGLTNSTIDDPTLTADTNPHLNLTCREKRNLAGALRHIEQGTTDDVMYHEMIGRDILNRETSRSIDMLDNITVKLVKTQEWDKAGRLTMVKDNLGNITRHIYDYRGNLRFTIDPEGFVTEKQYNANNKEIIQISFTTPISQVMLTSLTLATTPDDFKKNVKSDASDAVRYRVYDKDNLPYFEINVLEQTANGTLASVREWKYETGTTYTKRIDYARTLNLHECAIDFTKLTALDNLREYLQTKPIADSTHDRVKDVCRNALGKGIFIRDGEGYITEKRFAPNGKVVARTRYADKYDTLNFTQHPVKLRNQINISNVPNRTTYLVHDVYGNLRFTIDGEGFVKQYTYDKDNHPLVTTSYYNKLSPLPASLTQKLLALEQNPTAVINEMLVIVATLSNPKDVAVEQIYDAAGRHYKTKDGLGNVEEFKLNALGLVDSKIDKRKKEWIKKYDAAKQLKKDISPSVTISQVNQTAPNQPLTSTDVKTSVENTYGYDDGFNQTSIDFASNIDSRKVTKKFNKKRQFIGTVINNIKVDDEKTAVPSRDNRPENELEEITTSRVLDYEGRELVAVNEKGYPQFTVYDSNGRERFNIDRDGFITEYNYDFAFTEPNKIIHHAHNYSRDELTSHKEKGFTLLEVQNFITKLTSDEKLKDQSTSLYYDRRGLQNSATKDVIITANVGSDGQPTREDMAPETRWQHNAFGEVISEDVVCDKSGRTESTRKFYDRNGNVILIISPRGFVTVFDYGMRQIGPKQNSYVLLNQKEYAKAIDPNIAMSASDIRKLMEEKNTDAYDREYTYEYDCRLLQTAVMMSSLGEMFYEPKLDAQGKLVKGEGTHSLTFRTEYDAEGNIIAHVMPNGDKRYLQRDDRGDVIRETSLPKAMDVDVTVNGQPKKVYSIIEHKVNAHHQAVGSTSFINTCELSAVTCNGGEVMIPQVTRDPIQDNSSLLFMDTRGNPIVTQLPSGQLKFTTYDACSQMVRNYQWVTGYKQENGQINKITHLHANRQAFDARDNISMQEKYDDADPNPSCQTHRKHDAFRQCIAEGPTKDDMLVHREFDKAGYKIFTNEGNGKAQIIIPDAKGQNAVEITSQNNDLAAYQNNQEKAAQDFLEKDYENHKDKYQRTAVRRDAEGNANYTHLPFYSQKPKEAPLYQQVCFTVTKQTDNRQAFISWRIPEEEFLQPDFKFRRKGETSWNTLPAIKDQNTYSVNVSAYSADTYEYQLDFYYVDPNSNKRDQFPKYRAKGENVIDTGNYTDSTSPVWYLNESNKLVIAGKLTYNEGVISGVQLLDKAGNIYKRIAGTEQDDHSLVIDLSNEDSGNYDIKFIYNAPPGIEIKIGQTTNYQLNYYQPQFKFTGQGSIQAVPGTLPPQLTLNTIVAPCTVDWPINYFELGHKGNWQIAFLPADPLSTAIIYGMDTSNQPHYLGTFFNSGGFCSNGTMVGETSKFVAYQSACNGLPFLWLKLENNVQATAVNITIGPNTTRLCQLEPCGNGLYRFPVPAGFNPASFSAKLVNLDQTPTSSTIGKIELRTAKKIIPLSAKEIDVTGFTIDHYQKVGFCEGKYWENSRDYFFNYKWASNLPPNARLHVNHAGVEKDIYDITPLPRGPQGQQCFFQSMLGFQQPQEAGLISLKVTIDGDTLDLYKSTPPQSSSVPDATEYISDFDKGRSVRQKQTTTATYPNINLIYLSPLPPGVASAFVEVRTNTTVGEDVWVKPDYDKTTNGIVIRPTNLDPGTYQYRICLLDKDGNSINLDDYEFKHDHITDTKYPSEIKFPEKSKPVWSYGSLNVRKGAAGNLRFVSTNEQQIRETVKPVAHAEHDRYRNPTATITPENFSQAKKDKATDLDPYKDKTDYNLFNQPVRTTSAEGTWTDEQGKEHPFRQVNETLINSNKAVVGNIQPSDCNPNDPTAASNLSYVNNDGKTLMNQDADGVRVKSTIDAHDRMTSTSSDSAGKTNSTFAREGTLTVETRTNEDKTTEEFESNEENNLIRHKDRLKRNNYGDFDIAGHEILHINFDGASFRTSAFDLRTGMQLNFKDEDGNTKSWNDAPGITISDTDKYHGNCRSYTDMAGQVIEYILNFNKQMIEEKGNIDNLRKDIEKPRGASLVGNNQLSQDNPGPEAKHIKYLRDESGITQELLDLGARLVTRINHNQDGYEDSYYFISSDGRVYQATNTTYDKMHRIMQITDTRYVVNYGYDKNDNQRYARVYYADEKIKDNFFSEAWYKYTRGNRPLVRNGKMENGNIGIATGQGTAFSYGVTEKQDQVQSQENITREGEHRRAELHYRSDNVPTDIVTKNAVTNAVIATEHREVNAARRLTSSTQTGCDFKLLPSQPDRGEVFEFVIPTYVLSFNPLELHRYNQGNDEKITINDYPQLKDELHLYNNLSYDQAKVFAPFILGTLRQYNSKTYGDKSVDTTEYDNKNDGIHQQTHTEKNHSNVRTVTHPHPSGLPDTETNISTYTIPHGEDKGKNVTTTSQFQRLYAFGDQPRLCAIKKTGENVDAPHNYTVDDQHKVGELQCGMNANEDVTAVTGDLSDGNPQTLQESFRSFIMNSQQCMVYKQSALGRNYYFYAQKRPGQPPVLMAYFGDLPGNIKMAFTAKDRMRLAAASEKPIVVNIDTNNTPLTNFGMPSQYVTPRQMKYREIAAELDLTGYELAIAQANNSDNPEDEVQAGVPVSVPPLFFNVSNTAWNGPTCNAEVMIGSMYPVTPSPTIRPKPTKVNFVEQFVEIAATVAVMALAPEAFGAILGIALTGTEASIAGSMVVYGLSGATANVVGQGVRMGFGTQHGVNVKNFAADTICSAISGGIMQKLGGGPLVSQINKLTPGTIATNIVRSEVVAIAQQAALLTTRLQKHFDPRILAAAAFNGAVNTAADAAFGPTRTADGLPLPGTERHISLGNRIASAGVTSTAGSLGRAGIYHQRLSVEGVAVNTLGVMLGTTAGDSVSDEIIRRQEDAKRAELAAHAATLRSTPASSQHAVAQMGQRRANGPTLFAKNSSDASVQTSAKKLDAVKEAKATRGERWQDSPNAISWENKYREQVIGNLTYLSRLRMQIREDYEIQRAIDEDRDGFHVETRALGLLKAFGGGVQTVGSIVTGAATIETGIGPVAFGILAGKGIDTFGTGIRQMMSGREENSVFVDVAKGAGASQSFAEKLDMSIDLAGVVGELATVSRLGMYGRTAPKIIERERIGISASSPSEIAWGYGSLSTRQSKILESLVEPGDLLQLYKSNINVTDLAALTAHTGDEFALFTLGSRRIIVRGTARGLKIENELTDKLISQGWKWSAHTHPGLSDRLLMASGFPGDRQALELLNQERSLILNSVGRRSIFDLNNDYLLTEQPIASPSYQPGGF